MSSNSPTLSRASSGEDGSARALPPPVPPRPAGWVSSPIKIDGASFERQRTPYSSGGSQPRDQPSLGAERLPAQPCQDQIPLERERTPYRGVPQQSSETGSYQITPSGQSTAQNSHATSSRASTVQQDPGNNDSPNSNTAQWGALYYSNGTPTSTLTELLSSAFRCLDPEQTGYISPETYSSFLATIGWPETLDLWKVNMKHTTGYTAEDTADMFFINILRSLDIEHTYTKRNAALIPGSYGMPWMTSRGFVDLFTFEFAAETMLAPGCLNRLVQTYGLGRGRGLIPRGCLLQSKPAEVAERERIAVERIQAGNAEILEATRVYCEISQRGRDNALELLSPYRYTRVYGYNRASDLI